jgi:hypothetical protein
MGLYICVVLLFLNVEIEFELLENVDYLVIWPVVWYASKSQKVYMVIRSLFFMAK